MTRGPNGLADVIHDKLDDIAAEMEICEDRRERKALNKHAHMLKRMLRFFETRAGYVPG